jgi:tetratricopeptide (TPR) repeat protein
METAAKQAGIFWQLRQLIYNLAYSQRRTDRQFTPDEQRLTVEYRNAHYKALEPFEGKVTGADKPRWFELRGKYEMDLWLLDEVMKKYFTPDLRRAVYVALKGEMPTTNAPQGSTLTPNAAEIAAVSKSSSAGATPTSNTTRAKEHLAEGDKYQEAKQFDKALAAYQQAVAAEPSLKGYNKLGNTLLALKQYDNALAAYQKALDINPNSSNLHLNVGFVLFKKQEYTRAVAEYREELRVNPNNQLAYFWLGESLYELEEFSEAAAAFQQSYRLDPTSPEPLYRLGEVYLELGNKSEATQILRSLQQIKSQRVKDFKAEYDQLFSSDNSKDLLELGEAALEVEDGETFAFRLFRRAVQLDNSAQTQARAYRGIGEAYRWRKKYEKAIGAFQQALKISPNDPETNFDLGLSYLQAGMKAEAMQVYKLLQRLDRGRAQRLYAEMNKSQPLANTSTPTNQPENTSGNSPKSNQSQSSSSHGAAPAIQTKALPPTADDATQKLWVRAQAGDASAQNSLGWIYQNGRKGLPADLSEARQLYRRSAQQGNASGKANLCKLLNDMLHISDESDNDPSAPIQGIKASRADIEEAFQWCTLAANIGYVGAPKYILGLLYAKGGAGLSPDYEQAYFWLSMVTVISDGEGVIRDKVGKKLTPTKRAEIEQSAKAWKPPRQ